MLCFNRGADVEREGIALSRQSAGGALTAEGRAARASRDLYSTRGGTARFPPSELIRIEAFSA
jgi:hypothetical protein